MLKIESAKKSDNFIFNASHMYSTISNRIYLCLPANNFDKVEREIPAFVLNCETFKLYCYNKFCILIFTASDSSI